MVDLNLLVTHAMIWSWTFIKELSKVTLRAFDEAQVVTHTNRYPPISEIPSLSRVPSSPRSLISNHSSHILVLLSTTDEFVVLWYC